MLRTSIAMHRRTPDFEVRGVISFNLPGATDDDYHEALSGMHRKLERLIPGSLKAKYNSTYKELVVSLKCKTASEAQRTVNKLENFIQTAAMALKLR